MEEKLRAIVEKIEHSKLSNDDKEALYTQISESLHSFVLPVFLKYLPKDQLDSLANNPPKDMVTAFIDLIKNALKDGKALGEIATLADEVLVDVESALQKGGIA